MTYPHKKHVILSDQMDELKHRINLLKQKQKSSFTDKINKKGNLSKLILEGLQKTLDFFTSMLAFSKELPIIGFAIRMISAIPNAMTTLTDKKSSIGTKIFAMTMLLATTGLGIAAFVLGGIVAAGIGLAFAALGTLIEGISLLGSIVDKYQSAKAYKEKKVFTDLMEKRDPSAFDSEVYKDRLEVRALELNYLLNKPSSLSHVQIEDELEFIHKICTQRGWNQSSSSEDSPATKLSRLYQDREDMLLYLEKIIKIIDKEDKEGKNIEESKLIALVSNLQHEIAEIDEDIEKITEPLHKLKQKNLLANEAIAKSYTNFALGGVGVIFSAVGLMVFLGTLAAPPIAATILLGFGIGLATFALIKWGAELYADKKDEKILKERAQEHEETILEEALDCYSHDLSKNYQYDWKCSYSTSLSRILLSSETNVVSFTEPKDKVKNDVIETSIQAVDEPNSTKSEVFRY